MISFGIDIGKTYGFAFSENGKIIFSESLKFTSLSSFKRILKGVFEIWKPEICILAKSMGRHQKVIWQHGQYAGIVSLVCEEKNIQYFEFPDNRIRSVVMQKGNAKKKEVQEFLGIENEHQADAGLASLYYHFLNK